MNMIWCHLAAKTTFRSGSEQLVHRMNRRGVYSAHIANESVMILKKKYERLTQYFLLIIM